MKKCYKCLKKIDKSSKYGLHQDCFADWFQVDADEEFEQIARQDAGSQFEFGHESASAPWNSSFFAGKFLKYSARCGAHDYILKVQQEDAPELPFVEFTCNQLAQLLGIQVAKYTLIDFYDKPTFVIQNFIHNRKQISQLIHIYHYIKSAKDYDCENIIKIIEEKLQRADQLHAFIKLCLFDALIGNHDRHGRNLGFIVTAQKLAWSPFYDNTSYLGLEQGEMLKANFQPRGKIATKTVSDPLLSNYIDEFRRLGFEDIVKDFFLVIDIADINKTIEQGFYSKAMMHAMKKLVECRYQEFENALST